MTPWSRALLGAACGAVLTLALHPVSRPYLEEAIVHYTSPAVSSLSGLDQAVLPAPKNPAAAAEWIHLAAEKLQSGIPLSPNEIQTLLGIEQEGEEAQQDNAFWPQMRAVFLNRVGRDREAQEAWRRASNCKRWDDQQTDRLLKLRQRLVRAIGWDQAWTYGYVFFSRSDAAAAQIQRYAQLLVGSTDIDNNAGLRLRYETVANGDLLRDGSHSIKVGLHGYDMVERASYPKALSGTQGPRRIWIAETNLTAKLRQQGMLDESRRAFEAFDHNDWWRALTGIELPSGRSRSIGGQDSLRRSVLQEDSPDDNLRGLCLIAIGLAGFPGAMGLAALCSSLILLVGSLLQERLSRMRFFPTIFITAAALAAGCIVFLLTRQVMVGTCIAVTIEFLAVGPGTPRVRRNDDLGPLFLLTLWFIWLAVLCFFYLYICAISSSAKALGPLLGPAGEYFANSATFIGVSVIALSLICLVAPLYAIVRKFGTPDLLGLSLRRLGLIGAIAALTLCVLGGPAAVVADRMCARELSRLVENEPVYYMVPR